MKILIAAVATLLLSQATPARPTDDQMAAARAAFDRQMIDYPSARFRDVRADDRRICGLVNGKNRLGAYGGWQRFVAYNVDPVRLVVADEDDLGEIELVCDGSEAPPTAPDYATRLTHR